MAAGNAKINVIVDGLRQVQALEKSLNNISRLSGKINGVDNAPRVEQKVSKLKEAQRASMIRTRNIGDQIERLSAQGLNVDKARAAIKKAAAADSAKELLRAKAYQDAAANTLRTEQEITKETKRQQQFRSIRGGSGGGGGSGIIRGNKFDNRSNSAALRSGLISGAFPLLFGQGLLGGAAGFAGGAIGTKLGGQMGGFAGGLVVTAALQSILNFRDTVTELGKALDPANVNIDDAIQKLKIINTTRAAEIRLIEQSQGSQAALAAITKDTAKVIGNDGVMALREFAETMKLLGDAANKLALKIKSNLVEQVNNVFSLTGGDLNKAISNLGSEDPLVQQLKETEKALRELNTKPGMTDPTPNRTGAINPFDISGGKGTKPLNRRGEIEKARLENIKKATENEIRMTAAKQAGLRLDEALNVEHNKLIGSMEKEFETQNRILQLQKQGLNPALAKQVLLIEESAQNTLVGFEEQIKQIDLQIQKELESTNLNKFKLDLLEKEKQSLKDQLAINLQNIGVVKSEVIEQDKKNRILREQVATQKEIESILAGGMTNAVMGLIDGSRTLGSVLADVAKQLASMFLNKAFSSIFSGLFSSPSPAPALGPTYIAAQGGFSRSGGFKAFQYGGVVNSPTLGMVGEGGESEYIIPASKMSGAMARYSAGARGGAVIPGGSHESGTVAGGSGNTIVEYTGPTLNFNGDEYVPKSAVPEIINTAAKQGATAGRSQALSTLKNSRSQRATLGL